MKPTAILPLAVLAVACAAQPKPIAYNITLVRATVPSEKAPGVPWDEPEQDSGGFWAGACKLGATGLGFLLGGIGGAAVGGAASGACEGLIDKGNPDAVLPDPFIELVTKDGTATIPTQPNTTNPVWEQEFRVENSGRLTMRVHVYDSDSEDKEPIGSGEIKPRKQLGSTEVECGPAIVFFEVQPIYPEGDAP